MNLKIMYEHIPKLEIIAYKKLNAERSQISGNSSGNFSKDIFQGISEPKFPVALFDERDVAKAVVKLRVDKAVGLNRLSI